MVNNPLKQSLHEQAWRLCVWRTAFLREQNLMLELS